MRLIVAVLLFFLAPALPWAAADDKSKDEPGAAGSANELLERGQALAKEGDHAGAIDLYEQCRRAAETTGDAPLVCKAVLGKAHVRFSEGEYLLALEIFRHAMALAERLADRSLMGSCLNGLGLSLDRRGDPAAAVEHFERCLEVVGDHDDEMRAGTLSNLAAAHLTLGSPARALRYYEQSLELVRTLGDPAVVAAKLNNVGTVHMTLGDLTQAYRCFNAALSVAEEQGLRALEASALNNLGTLATRVVESGRAIDYYERALKLKEALNDRPGEASVLVNLSLPHLQLGRTAEARACLERGLAIFEELGDRIAIAKAVASLGNVHLMLREHEAAVTRYRRALLLADESGAPETRLRILIALGQIELDRQRFRESLAHLHEAVELMNELVLGLADRQGAIARQAWVPLLRLGLSAATAAQDPAELLFFLESSRAGTLLEALGGRRIVADAVLPESLRAAERDARRDEAAAVLRYRYALASGKRRRIRDQRKEVDAARQAVMQVVERIQREAKRAAGLMYREPDDLATIQKRLRPGEVLVVYDVIYRFTALVVTREEGRIVPLSAGTGLAQTCERLARSDPEVDTADAVEKLRKLVLDPLGLDDSTTRLLICPDGPLTYVPFSLLIPGCEICYLPSATTHGVLLAQHSRGGTDVLALGDPQYGARSDGLAPLPATGAEARAVGDVVLLGPKATPANLKRALAGKTRWRAVHLACHGIFDPEQPALSRLALTAGAGDEGRLSCLEVLRMRFPSDLVVLSACETARGKLVYGEGAMGLTRAFMLAGASTVLCSLWKVDDEATKALMVTFYKLWNPKEGEGLPAVTALKQAQEFVRGHEKWKHPYYWAAWVLWGLPD